MSCTISSVDSVQHPVKGFEQDLVKTQQLMKKYKERIKMSCSATILPLIMQLITITIFSVIVCDHFLWRNEEARCRT